MDTLKKLLPNSVKSIIKKTYAYIFFIIDFKEFKKQSEKTTRFNVTWGDRYPHLLDKTANTPFDSHYIYHPAWAARIVKKINPKFHVDISSTLHFSSSVSAFIPVHFYDYRPAHLTLSNLSSEKADLLSLPLKDNSVTSLSCMHTVEHVGLGRYGDPINPDGDIEAMKELQRVLTLGGNLIFVVPIGKPAVYFNAHRVYAYEQIMDYFGELTLIEFSLIPDNAAQIGMIENATKEQADTQRYGCGCFWFQKKA